MFVFSYIHKEYMKYIKKKNIKNVDNDNDNDNDNGYYIDKRYGVIEYIIDNKDNTFTVKFIDNNKKYIFICQKELLEFNNETYYFIENSNIKNEFVVFNESIPNIIDLSNNEFNIVDPYIEENTIKEQFYFDNPLSNVKIRNI